MFALPALFVPKKSFKINILVTRKKWQTLQKLYCVQVSLVLTSLTFIVECVTMIHLILVAYHDMISCGLL